MTPYELEAWAFSLDLEERPEAFLVVADSFEEHGDLKSAEIRRSWADQMSHTLEIDSLTKKARYRRDNPFSEWEGCCWSIVDSSFHTYKAWTGVPGGVYTGKGKDPPHWGIHPLLANDPRPKNMWYDREGHWNEWEALMVLSIAELAIRSNSANAKL
jgi:hypothetical protein